MRIVIIYESMFGNTHAVAERMADAARRHGDTEVVPVTHAGADTIAGADLVIVGGPTHVHGMSSERTRHAAVDELAKHPGTELDPDAEGPGLRDWFDSLPSIAHVPAAAFDTRFDANALLTGRASKGIDHRLRHHDFRVVAAPESFLVDKDNHLLDGEAGRAERWAESVISAAAGTAAG